jgi:hypothetical protein
MLHCISHSQYVILSYQVLSKTVAHFSAILYNHIDHRIPVFGGHSLLPSGSEEVVDRAVDERVLYIELLVHGLFLDSIRH